MCKKIMKRKIRENKLKRNKMNSGGFIFANWSSEDFSRGFNFANLTQNSRKFVPQMITLLKYYVENKLEKLLVLH